jgi:hypothetical protein
VPLSAYHDGTVVAEQATEDHPLLHWHVHASRPFGGGLEVRPTKVHCEQPFVASIVDIQVSVFALPQTPFTGAPHAAIVTPLGRPFLKEFHSFILRVGIKRAVH